MRPRASSQDGWPCSQVPSGSTQQPSVASQPPSSSTWRWGSSSGGGSLLFPPSLGGGGGGGRVRPRGGVPGPRPPTGPLGGARQGIGRSRLGTTAQPGQGG